MPKVTNCVRFAAFCVQVGVLAWALPTSSTAGEYLWWCVHCLASQLWWHSPSCLRAPASSYRWESGNRDYCQKRWWGIQNCAFGYNFRMKLKCTITFPSDLDVISIKLLNAMLSRWASTTRPGWFSSTSMTRTWEPAENRRESSRWVDIAQGAPAWLDQTGNLLTSVSPYRSIG